MLAASRVFLRRMGASASRTNEAQLAVINNLIEENKIVVFSKTTCGFCVRTKELLTQLKVPFKAVELNQQADGSQLQQVLGDMTGASSVPRVFIHKKCIGGCSETMALHEKGKLLEIIQNQSNL